MIHPTAEVHQNAKISANVQIGAYCNIGDGVILSNGVILEPHVTIQGDVTIAEHTHIYPFVHIGEGRTIIDIGSYCHIREFTKIAINDTDTMPIHIYDNCYIMAYTDIRSGVTVEDNCIITNHVVLGKGSHCQPKVVIGAKATIAADCTIGTGTMIGGVSTVTHDIPPFCLVEGSPVAQIRGLNLVGMRRRFEDRESIGEVKRTFIQLKKEAFSSEKAATLLAQIQDTYAKIFVAFVSTHTIHKQ